MSAPCPKCGHIRQPKEAGSADVCPQCGVVYAKYLAMLHSRVNESMRGTPKEGLHRHVTRPQAIGGVLLAVGLIWYFEHRNAESPPPTPRPALSPAQAPNRAAEKSQNDLTKQAKKSPEDIERDRIKRLELDAREVCFDAIRRNAMFPSSVDIAWFTGTATQRHGNSTLVKAAFTSKNAQGSVLPFYGQCQVNDDGRLAHFRQIPR